MADGPSPVVQRRRLRSELRKARQDAELTQEQVAETMDWSLSKIIRIEAGSVGISTNDLKALLRLYKILDTGRAEELIALARAARERSWWNVPRYALPPRLVQFIEHEAAASTIRSFEPLLVPELLQTEEYARAVLRQFNERITEGRMDDLIYVLMKRQELLSRPNPPTLNFILDEAVIYRLAEGKEVMRRQVDRLVDMADSPNVTVEVVPFRVGIHPGMNGPFVIHEFPDTDDDVLFLAGPRGNMISWDDQEEIMIFRSAFEHLRELSLGPRDSITYLESKAGG